MARRKNGPVIVWQYWPDNWDEALTREENQAKNLKRLNTKSGLEKLWDKQVEINKAKNKNKR